MSLSITLDRRVVAGAATVLALVSAFVAGDLLGDGTTPAQAVPATAQAEAPPTGITVTGLGRATGTPDVLTLQLSVTRTRPDASSALADAGATITKARESLRHHGVADADVATSGLNVGPHYAYDGGRQRADGYTATESLTAQLRDVGKAGEAISAAQRAGGNAVMINGVSFDLHNDSALLATARKAAVADAKARAGQYADAAGRKVGPVQSIKETVQPPRPVPVYLSAAPMPAGKAVPIDPGTSELTVTVEVVFALA